MKQSDTTAFLLFIVLVWVSVALGVLLAGILPQLPHAVRSVMAPGQRPDPAVNAITG